MGIPIIGELISKVLKPVLGFADDLHLSGEEKQAYQLKVMEAQTTLAVKMETAITAEVNAKKEVMLAELSQGDTYVKRARPSIIYAGLLLALVEAALKAVGHFTGNPMPEITSFVPKEFWMAWTGVAGSFVIGRSAERRGIQNKFVALASGINK